MENKKQNKKEFDHKKGWKYTTFPRLLDPKKGQIIGITGGIATGKTFVLECMKQAGFEVFNADEVVHSLLLRDGRAFTEVAALCPESATEAGINRKILGEKIFRDPEKLKKLESILHPLVRDEQVKFTVKVKNTTGKSIVFEVPLLFENKREQYYDQIILTLCPISVQKERAMSRNNMTEEKFDAIVKRQMLDTLKLKKAHFAIKTGKTLEDTMKQVRSIIYDGNKAPNNTRYGNHRFNKERPSNRDSVRRAK